MTVTDIDKQQKINPILNMPKLYHSLMALRLEVDQSIVDSLAEVVGESITEAISQAKAEQREEMIEKIEKLESYALDDTRNPVYAYKKSDVIHSLNEGAK